jgi:hypothetical protein
MEGKFVEDVGEESHPVYLAWGISGRGVQSTKSNAHSQRFKGKELV